MGSLPSQQLCLCPPAPGAGRPPRVTLIQLAAVLIEGAPRCPRRPQGQQSQGSSGVDTAGQEACSESASRAPCQNVASTEHGPCCFCKPTAVLAPSQPPGNTS